MKQGRGDESKLHEWSDFPNRIISSGGMHFPGVFPFSPFSFRSHHFSYHLTPELIDAPLQVPCPSSCSTVLCPVATFMFSQHLSYQPNSTFPNPQSAFHTQSNRTKALRILQKPGPSHLHPRVTGEMLVRTTHRV